MNVKDWLRQSALSTRRVQSKITGLSELGLLFETAPVQDPKQIDLATDCNIDENILWLDPYLNYIMYNREYLTPQIRSINNWFHSEAKLPWSYDYPLANHIVTNKISANREMPLLAPL